MDNRIFEDWDHYFISEAYLSARKSKKNTQVGAVIVSQDKEIIAKGYNGFPRLFDDNSIDARELSSVATVHAEENCILYCSKVGIATNNCSMYVNMACCSRCARMISQAGITSVIIHKEFPIQPKWQAESQLALRIFEQCRVNVRWWSGIPLIREIRVNGEWYNSV